MAAFKEVLQAFFGIALTTLDRGWHARDLGGHTEKLLERLGADKRHVLGLEWDAKALRLARERLHAFGPRFDSEQGSYADLSNILAKKNMTTVQGLLLDLGLSSLQLDDPARGFSFY